ncbi:MAG TPA: methionine adenosyltransferase, partial [candidate division Zixibacteria bacterium]|nr:methionine adenosyltransferase [candidate division Zixibacteria bacterium]
MAGRNFLFTSESVTEGHPDKVCDQVSDGVLDEVLKQDIRGRVACESFVTVGLTIVGGEITTSAYVDIRSLVRDIVKNIGYTDPKFGYAYNSSAILNAIGSQSPDIAQGVDIGGAGDQGLMTGYACRETEELMPTPVMLAHKLTMRLAEVRKQDILSYLGPDGKSQVTVEYRDGKPERVDAVVLSTQHTEEILDRTGDKITEKSRQEIIDNVIKPIVPSGMLDEKTKYY